MNFLLHHHLATRDLSSPAAAVGAMLPDLWRMADRRVRARPSSEIAHAAIAAPASARELLDGVQHHLDADVWFHATRVFRDGERLTAERFRAAVAAVDAPRIGHFAHIGWELCLDGALLRTAGTANVTGAIDAAFAALGRDALAAAADLHHFARTARTDEARAAFDDRMARLIVAITRGRWVDGYTTGAGIADRLGSIRAMVGLAPLEAPAAAALARALDALLIDAEHALVALLAERRGQ